MTQRVLVTGGAGFIGSHLVELLLQERYEVRVLDNLSYGQREWVPSAAELVVGDVRRPEDCLRACQGVSGICHLAAMSRSAASLENLDDCTQSNIVGTQNLLVAARECQVSRLVYSGSSTYYGSQPIPHCEGGPPDFLNLYGLSKYVGEEDRLLFDRLYDLSTVVLRYFNVYGPRQPTSGVYALVLGIFLERARRGLPLEIHGDGSQRRDFIHVRDVARANLLALRSPVRQRVYNVGSGENISVKELADLISSSQTHGPARVADALATLADISRIKAELGWLPQVAFPEGLRELQEAPLIRELSVACPAYNEAAHLEALVRQWQAFLAEFPGLERYEIVICNDGSPDGTGPLLDRLATELPCLRPCHHPRNRGAAKALTRAISQTRMEWILLLDSDGQFPISNLSALKQAVEGSGALAAHGVRARKSASALARLGSWGSGQVCNLIYGTSVRDFNCALKLVHGPTLRSLGLEARHLNYSTETTGKLLERGVQMVEVEIEHRPRASGVSSVKLVRDSLSRLLFVAYLAFRRALIQARVIDPCN